MSIRKFTFNNLAGAIIPMFVTLVTVPLYLKAVGEVRYGVLALVWVVLGYFSFMDMGLGKATANQIALLRDATAKERGDIFWTAIVVNGGFGILAALILWAIGSYLLGSVLKMPAQFSQEALDALPWMIATLPLALVTSVLIGALEGKNSFAILNLLQIAGTVVFQIVPLVVACKYSPSLSYVIPAAVVSRVVMNIPLLFACFRSLPLSSKPCISFASTKSLLSYGGWVAISGIIGPVIDSIDRLLIGSMIGAQAVTFYTVPYQLVTKARVIPSSFTRALFPKFAAEDPVAARNLASKSLRILLIVMTPVILLGILLLKPFLTIWVGKDLAPVASSLGEVLLFGVWANSLAQIPCFFLMGKGHPSVVAKLHALEIGPFLLILWAAMHFWGVHGAAWAWSIRAGLDAILLFRISGIFKGNIFNLAVSALIIIGAIVCANFVAERDWFWRAALLPLSFLSIGLWLKSKTNFDILKELLPLKFFKSYSIPG